MSEYHQDDLVWEISAMERQLKHNPGLESDTGFTDRLSTLRETVTELNSLRADLAEERGRNNQLHRRAQQAESSRRERIDQKNEEFAEYCGWKEREKELRAELAKEKDYGDKAVKTIIDLENDLAEAERERDEAVDGMRLFSAIAGGMCWLHATQNDLDKAKEESDPYKGLSKEGRILSCRIQAVFDRVNGERHEARQQLAAAVERAERAEAEAKRYEHLSGRTHEHIMRFIDAEKENDHFRRIMECTAHKLETEESSPKIEAERLRGALAGNPLPEVDLSFLETDGKK